MARKRAQSPVQSGAVPEPCERGRTKKRATDDENVTESQQFLALLPALKKKQGDYKEIAQLRTKIAGDQRNLRALLQQRLRQAKTERTRRREDISEIVFTAFAPPGASSRSETFKYTSYPGTAIALNPTYASAAAMINTSKGLLAEFDRIESVVTETTQDDQVPITGTWEVEANETKKVMDLGHKVALHKVKKMLGADEQDGKTQAGEEDEEIEEILRYVPIDCELEQALRYTERGVKRMAKGLPRDMTN